MPLISNKDFKKVFNQSITFDLHESYNKEMRLPTKKMFLVDSHITNLREYLLNTVIETYIEELNNKNIKNSFEFKTPVKVEKVKFNTIFEFKHHLTEILAESTGITVDIPDEEVETKISSLYTYEEKYDLLSLSKFLNNIKKDSKTHYRGAKNIFSYLNVGAGVVSVKGVDGNALFEGLLWNDLVFNYTGDVAILNAFLLATKGHVASVKTLSTKEVLSELNPNEYFLTTLGYIQNAYGDIKPLCSGANVLQINREENYFSLIQKCYHDLVDSEIFYPTGEKILSKNDFSNYFNADYEFSELEVNHFQSSSNKKLKTIDNEEIISFQYEDEDTIFFEASVLQDIIKRYTIPVIEKLTGFKKDEIQNMISFHFYQYDKMINNGDILGYIKLAKAKNFSRLEIIQSVQKAINYSIIANKKVEEFKDIIKEFNQITNSDFKYLSPSLLDKVEEDENVKRISKIPNNKDGMIKEDIKYVELKDISSNIISEDMFVDILKFYYENQRDYNMIFNYFNLLKNSYNITDFYNEISQRSESSNQVTYSYKNVVSIKKENAAFGLNSEKEKVSLIDNQLLG